jgi:hypothetical protein
VLQVTLEKKVIMFEFAPFLTQQRLHYRIWLEGHFSSLTTCAHSIPLLILNPYLCTIGNNNNKKSNEDGGIVMLAKNRYSCPYFHLLLLFIYNNQFLLQKVEWKRKSFLFFYISLSLAHSCFFHITSRMLPLYESSFLLSSSAATQQQKKNNKIQSFYFYYRLASECI